jgi:hypothetical protein
MFKTVSSDVPVFEFIFGVLQITMGSDSMPQVLEHGPDLGSNSSVDDLSSGM